MPRFYVGMPDGRWRVFSTIADGFVTEPMTFDELREYRRKRATEKCDWETSTLLTDRPRINVMSYEDAMDYLAEMEVDE